MAGVDRKHSEERAVANSSPLCGKPREGVGRRGLVSGSMVFLDRTPGLIPKGHSYLTHAPARCPRPSPLVRAYCCLACFW